MIVVKQLMDHCHRFFGSQGDLYQSEDADILIAVYPATRKRGWWTYATLELHEMGATEYLAYSYQFEQRMITHLAKIAAQVIRQWESQSTRLESGSVFSLGDTIVEKSVLNHMVLTPAYYEEAGLEYYTNGKDVIRFMMLHAIADSEAKFLEQYGLMALQEWLAHSGVDSLNVTRTPAI
ncbi:suppressor of fused domain protein [Brevibacillus sp. HB1.3]|uniref:suppressor of fused domain protein n=1 Tax=Brevibacillus sp. HB1.3 TaxID=2738842 RepID=UPI001551A8C0|nr:suppressor of fused domain protein [Brevibacillus sp. HB1.3]NQF15075.1 suppressor of fused domain protein [Brevibacillus sp. HB1.3]